MHEQLPVVLTSRDFSILEGLLSQGAEPFPGARETLRRKLAAASIVFPADVPAEVVTLHSRIRLRIGSGAVREGVLAGDPEGKSAEQAISLLSPLGLAIVGGAEGQLVQAGREDGGFDDVFIEKVLDQPERRIGTVIENVPRVIPFRAARGRPAVPTFGGDDDPGPSAA